MDELVIKMDVDAQTRSKIKDTIKGVVITGIDQTSNAADRRLTPGTVVVKLGEELVSTPADIEGRIEQLKKSGKKSVLLLLATPDGDTNFVALPLN